MLFRFTISPVSATLRRVPDKKSPSMVLQLAVLTISRLFLSAGLRMVYPFLPAFARGLGVPIETIAPLVSMRGFAGLLSPVFSPLSERYGRRPILALSLVLFALACAFVVIWPSYWPFGITIAVIALAKVIFDPAMQAYIGDVVPYKQRGRAISVTELSWAGAFLLAVPLVGLAMEKQGWEMPFLWLAILGIGGAFMLWRIIPRADGRSGEVTDLRSTFLVIKKHPVIWAASLYILLSMAANEVLLIVYGSWMEVSFDLSLATLGLATAVIGAAEITGELVVGPVVDWLGKRPVIIVTGLLTGLTYIVMPYFGGSLASALVSLFVLFLFFEMTVVGGVPLMTELVPTARGVVMSVILATGGLGRAIGALIGFSIWSGGGFKAVGIVAGVVMLISIVILYLWVREAATDPQSPASSPQSPASKQGVPNEEN
jgi:predicted MFS family arabinose efflux permease